MDLPVIFETPVEPEWLDYNGHVRDAYYAVAFSLAIDAMMDDLGLDETYRERTACTLYTLEVHLHFLAETKAGDVLTVRMRVLACDSKRLHALFLMSRGDGELVSAQDTMLLHVDQNAGPASSAFPEPVLERLQSLAKGHAALPAAEHTARSMGLRPKAA
ncbi:MAG: thioesterase family protein [Pseudomonadota bacterium]